MKKLIKNMCYIGRTSPAPCW